jgi:uncharacterized membrane-anchored protein YhcB (DUF1043 family)
MINFLVGVFVGIVISTIGLVAIAQKIDESVNSLKQTIEQSASKGQRT